MISYNIISYVFLIIIVTISKLCLESKLNKYASNSDVNSKLPGIANIY